MHVLVSGATGFIGRRLCAELAEAGHTVVALSRNAVRARQRVPSLSGAFQWAPMEAPPPAEAFDGVEAVVNLVGASIFGWWTARKRRVIYDSRVLSTRHLVDAIERLNTRPRTLVSASAIGYYGDRGDMELTETDAPGTAFLAGVSVDWEAEAARAEGLGLRVVRLRTSLVIGPGAFILRVLGPFYRLGLGGPIGSGRQWWPWVHLADHTGLVRFVLDHQVSGPVNVTAPAPVTQREFAKALGRVLRRPAVLPEPAFALKLALGEFSSEVLNSRRVLPQAALAAGYAFRFTELEPALRDVLARPLKARTQV